jgi:transcriptional regulator with XRE-family HTH domain
MSQEELAHKIGYKHKSSINKIELGIQGLTQSKIKMIADALLTTPSDIMGWTDPPSQVQQRAKPCELFEECHENDVSETIALLLQLDNNDRAEIRGEIKQMLKDKKYSKEEGLRNA